MKKRLVIVLTVLLTLLVTLTFGQAVYYFQKDEYLPEESHEDLRIIKMVLKSEGLYEGLVDDEYNSEIVKSIKVFQKNNNLEANGKIDKAFIELIYSSENYPFLKPGMYKIGMEKDDVVFIQKALDELGYFSNSEYTKYFGFKTQKAVMDFQNANGMSSDGIIGKETILLLYDKGLIDTDVSKVKRLVGNLNYNIYRKGDNLPDIKILQEALSNEVEFGYGEFTSNFGEVTENMVQNFQEKYGIEVDGICGKATIEKLTELGYVTNNTIVSRGSKIDGRYGEYLSWSSMKKMVKFKSTKLVIQDFYTGKTFNVLASYGSNHIDVEMLSKNDTATVKALWGGKFGWERRPVLVYINNRVIAASLNGMPHAGREDYPEGVTVSNRSGDFGRGYNYDGVKGNEMSGVICLHFRGSKLHKNDRMDPQHQHAIKVAAGKQ